MAEQLIGSKIGGVFKTLKFDEETNGLKFKKTDGSEVEIVGGGGGSTVKMIQMIRPISDESILPKVEISSDNSFTNILHTIDASLASDRANFMVYAEDSGWMSLNADVVGGGNDGQSPDGIHDFAYGLGTPFDNAIVLCDLSGIEVEEPFFIRWCWQTVDSNGAVVKTNVNGVLTNVATSWQSTQFPTSPAFTPNVPNQGTLKAVALTQEQYDAMEIHDDNTLYVIVD